MEYFSMLFILGLILFITIKFYSNCKKTDESIFQLYTEILQMRAYMRMKDKFDNDKIWMDDLNKYYPKEKRVNREEGQ